MKNSLSPKSPAVSPPADDSASPADFLTVFETKSGKILTKRFLADGTKQDFSGGSHFRIRLLPAATWPELLESLTKVVETPEACTVRGAPVVDCPLADDFARGLVPKAEDELVYRRKESRTCAQLKEWQDDENPDYAERLRLEHAPHAPGECDGEPANLVPVPRHWVVYDFDGTDSDFDLATPEASIRAWHATLPVELRAAQSAFFPSASAHLETFVRGKLVVWYAEPVSETQAHAFATHYRADPSVAWCHQPNYFAAPVFAEGCEDPLSGRRMPIVFDGEPAIAPAASALKATANRPAPVLLADLPPGDAGIVAALGPEAEMVGHRFAICCGLAGVMRKLSFEKEDFAAVITEWLPAKDRASRLKHALGAWNKTPEGVSGRGKLVAEVGEKHAAVIIAACKAHPKYNPPKLDATLEAWGAARELRKAAKAEAEQRAEAANDTAPAEVAGEADDPYVLLGRKVDLTAPAEPMAYLVEGLPFAPGGKVNALAGPPKGGKSPWALWFCICVCTKRDFLKRKILRPGPCLYLDGETGYLAHLRFERMCNDAGINPGSVPLQFRDVETVFSDKYLQTLEALLRAEPKVLVVIDTYGAMLGGDTEYNTADFAKWLRGLGRLSRAIDVVILVLIHEKKTNNGRTTGSGLEMISGSFSAAGAMQGCVSLRPAGESNEDPIVVSCSRAPERGFKSFRMVWEDIDAPSTGEGLGSRLAGKDWGLRPVVIDTTAEEVAVDDSEVDAAKRMVRALERKTDPQATKTWLAARSGLTKGKGLKLVLKLEDDGVLEEKEFNGGNTVRYRIAPPGDVCANGRAKWGLGGGKAAR